MFRKSALAKAGPRSAFTLIELLVVIAIIGVLAALTTAAVMRVRTKGKELEVRNDLTSLDTAIGSFRAKMANTPIPSGGGGTAGTFRLCSNYTDASGNFVSPFTANDPEVQILKRMFPRISLADNGLRVPGSVTQSSTGTLIPPSAPVLLDPNQCMVFFLSGGSFTDYTGFASDPFIPFAPSPPPGVTPSAGNWQATSAKRLSNGAFYEFKSTRLIKPNAYNPVEHPEYANFKLRFVGDAAGRGLDEAWFVDPWGHPYLYWASTNGNDYTTTAITIGPWGGQYSYRGTAGPNPKPFQESTNKFVNPKTHQIVSMGFDQKLGIGGLYAAGSGEYLGDGVGTDDFANFRGLRLGAAGAD